MKKLMMLALCAFAANAVIAAVKIGDLYYDLDDSTMTAEVVKDSSYKELTSLEIPMSVSSEDETYTVTSIGEEAFYNCLKQRVELTIPSSVTNIGDKAFGGCSGLSGELIIPSSVACIGNMVFASCCGLTGVTIPSSVKSIGMSAFAECSGLTGELAIPSSVKSIGMSAFADCSGLTGELAIPSSVTNLGKYAFSDCSGLTGVTIPSSVTVISDYAFYGCSGLTAVTIPSSVKSIGMSAFNGCSGLTGELAIPSGVTNLGKYAFSDCGGLTAVTIPSSVTNIANFAFSFCEKLAEVTLLANEPPTVGTSVFDEASDLLVIFVPPESAEKYRVSDGWCSYAEKICELWTAGDTVKAYRNGSTLFIMGSGAMNDFASTANVPWAGIADEVTAVMIAETVTHVGKNALAVFDDFVTVDGTPLSTYRTVSVVETKINGMPIDGYNAAVRRLNVGEEWNEASPASAAPVIPDDKVLVSKEEIAAAKAEAISIADGVVSLCVTVNTNGNFTAETKDWQPVELKSENVKVEDGKIVISIPVSDKSGFMILQSGDAKVPNAAVTHEPWYTPIE